MSKKIVGNIGEMLKLIASPVYICLHVFYTCLGQLKWAVFPVKRKEANMKGRFSRFLH